MLKKSNLKYLAISVVLLLISGSFVTSTLDILRNNQRLQEEQASVKALEQQKSALEQQVAYKKTQDFVEESARNDLNMIKPGERVYVVAGSQVAAAPTPAVKSASTDSNEGFASVEEVKNHPYLDQNWYYWYRLFF